MNTLAKYMMLSGNRSNDDNRMMREPDRMNYGMEYRGGYEDNYTDNMRDDRHEYTPAESRFRDRRGREHYDNGKYAPMRSAYEDDDFSRSGDYYGEMYNDDESRRSWEIIENRGDMGRPMSMHQEERSIEHKPNVIGFSSAKSSMHRNAASPMNKEMADEWMAGIVNEDGTKGAHWSMQEVKSLMQQKGIDCDPVQLWVAMNAEYSDRQKVNKKYGVDRTDFYLDSAIAYWLKDADAVKDKLSTYYTYVVKH